MTPARTIATLDRMLTASGEEITLRRGTVAPFTDLAVRASVRHYDGQELTGGIVAGDAKVVISPTGLDATAWVNAAGAAGTPPFNPDRRIPRVGDRAIIAGRNRRIEFSKPVLVDGVLVRVDLTVR